MSNQNEALNLLEKMILIRQFEESAAEYYSSGHIRGFLHLNIGQEAISVGVMDCLQAEDQVFATYREHGHAIARGCDVNQIMAELFGKVSGLCRGRGGSMHLFDVGRKFFGGSAIVGGALPLAVGMGLANKMLGNGLICVCFFGEGAVAEGEFHESLNLAALWNLPVLFICENNLYAMGTSINRSEAETDLVLKAAGYDIEGLSGDGMDLMAVIDSTTRALHFMKEHHRPYFIEFKTYRFRAHSMFDPDLYRSKDEVMKWTLRDPILLYKQFLQNKNIIDDRIWTNTQEKVKSTIKDAIDFAESATFESVEDLLSHVYYEG